MKENALYKPYYNWNIAMAVLAILALGAFAWMMRFHCVFFDFLLYTAGEYMLFFILWVIKTCRFPRRQYPRWKIPWISVIVPLLTIAAADRLMPDGYFKMSYLMIEGLFLILCCAGPLKNAYYTMKYHISDFKYVEELVATYPESKNKLK